MKTKRRPLSKPAKKLIILTPYKLTPSKEKGFFIFSLCKAPSRQKTIFIVRNITEIRKAGKTCFYSA
jgi:hypothetical protein